MEYDPKEYHRGYFTNGRKAAAWGDIVDVADAPGMELVALHMGDHGMVAVDYDPRNADETTSGWLREFGVSDSQTRCHETLSGGRHWLFEAPDDAYLKAAKPVPGIDLIEYLLFVPPSKGYSVIGGDEVLPVPEKLKAFWAGLQRPSEGPSQAHDSTYQAGSRDTDVFSYLRALRGKHPTLEAMDLYHLAKSQIWPLIEQPEGNLFTEADLLAKCNHVMQYGAFDAGTEDIAGQRLGQSTQHLRSLDIPPLESLIGPFTAGGVYIVGGPPGSGKSLWTLALAHQIASGGQMSNWKAPKARPVLYVDGEMPLRFTHPRLETVPDVAGVDMILEDQFMDEGEMPDLANPAWQSHFLESQYVDHYGVMIFDTLSSLVSAGKDSNEREAEYWGQMKEFNSKLRALGLTVIWIDHTTGYDSKKMVGSYSKLRGIEAAVVITDLRADFQDPPKFNMTTTKNRVYREGSPPFKSCWHFSAGMPEKWFRTEYEEASNKTS